MTGVFRFALTVLFLMPAASAWANHGPDGVLPHELTPLGMFLAADLVVKGVMIGLALASLATWTVWAAKSFELTAAKRRARNAAAALGEARTLREAAERLGFDPSPAGALVRAAAAEIPT